MAMDVFCMGTAHLLGLLALLSAVQQVKSWSISTPTTVTAVEGSCVVVPCQTQPHSRVIWYKYHKMNYPVVYDGLSPQAMAYQFRGRTSVLGTAAEGNCSLLIERVSRNDHLLQVYVWIDPETETSQKFHEHTVIILVERNTPTISVQSQIVEGMTFLVNCTIKYSCSHSPPFIRWQTSQVLQNSTEKVFNGSLWEQWLFLETLHVTATYDMHNSKMRCSAIFKSYTKHSQQITLNILYKPVSVTVVQEDDGVKEGGDISVKCSADSNPEPDTYSWLQRHMGQINKLKSTQRRITLYSITKDTSVSCTAGNGVGAGQSEWLDLDVQYAPVILPETSCSQERGILRCVCQAEASPNASLYWVIDGNYTLPSSLISKSTKQKHSIVGEISIPAKNQAYVSCTAWNPFGNDTKWISITKSSNPLSLPVWLMLIGITLLLGCAMFINRKYSRKSSDPEIAVQDEVEERVHNEAMQSGLQGSDGNPQEERLSSVCESNCEK